jgi:hypothetical protein
MVTRSVDLGLAIDAARISDVASKALRGGRLSVKRAGASIAVSAGQMRLSNVSLDSKDAALSLAGSLDLTDGSIDGRLVLAGLDQVAGSRPDIFMALQGSVAAPVRIIDVSALAGWLTLRAVETQSKQLHEIESAQQPPNAAMSKPKSQQAPALPAPLNVRPLSAPGRGKRGEASVGAQH